MFRFLSREIGPPLPQLTFIKIHWAYFIVTCSIFSAIFWASSRPHGSIAYIDSLFLVIAAMTQAGMNTINLSSLNTFQQCLLAILIICGNQISISAVVVYVRKRAFEKRFKSATKAQEKQEPAVAIFCDKPSPEKYSDLRSRPQTLHRAHNSSHIFQLRGAPSLRSINKSEVNGNSKNGKTSPTSLLDPDIITLQDPEPIVGLAYISNAPGRWINPRIDHLPIHGTVNRNGLFFGLSPQDKEYVRCVEYRALRLLAYLVPAYFFFFQVFGCLTLGAYMAHDKAVVALANDQNPWWVGIFFGIAAFSNTGMSLLDLSTTPFQTSIFPLITFSILMWAGNTAYPVFLRVILWIASRLLPGTPAYQELRSTISFILKYPRRVYTNLFPSAQTWWLALVLVLLNGIDWTAFEVLNRANPVVTSIPMGYRIVDGLFQSFAVRSSGFCVISISSLAVGLQALYVMMMYISMFPVVMLMRNSNVYEERSLGIYAEDMDRKNTRDPDSMKPVRTRRLYFLREQVQRQLGHDLWFITICIVLVIWIETPRIVADPINYSVFNIIFEVVSAYGCVGLSIGYPNVAYAFSGTWHTSSKLVLCVMMLRGRHRGLPVDIDKAIQLPGEGPEEADGSNEIWNLR